MGKTKTKRSLERLRRRWEDNIKIVIQEIRWGNELDLSVSG